MVLCAVMSLLAMNVASAQTTLISPTGDGGFDNGTTFTANGWTLVNHSATTNNNWYVGAVPVSAAGTNAAYVSNDGGTTWAYSNSTASTAHFYRDVTVAANHPKIELNFSWKGNGESGWDRLLIYVAPTTLTPVAGTPASNSSVLTGATLVYTQTVFPQAAYGNTQVFLPSSLAGTTFRLIFTWQNDGSLGTTPPVSVDNISLVSNVAGNFTSVASGNWGTAATWDLNAVPTAVDNVTIATGHVVELAAAAATVQANNISISGTLGFPNTATAPLVAGTQLIGNNITINAGGTLNAFAATTATPPVYTGRTVTVLGNFVNNGSADFSRGTTSNSILQFQGSPTLLGGSATQTLSGTGTFVNGAIRDLRFWSATSLTLARQVSVSSRVIHGQGDVINLNNLTLDNALGTASGTAQNGVMYSKSLALLPYVSSNTFNIATGANIFLEYVFYGAGGAVPATQVPIPVYNVGAEMPASRTLAGLRVSTTGKVVLGAGNVTLTSASNATSAATPFIGTTFPPALILSGGIVEVNPGNEIYINNPLNAGLNTGSATAFVDGRIRQIVTATTAASRNFPVGKISRPGNVVVAGLTGTALEVAVEPLLTSPSGAAATPLTTAMGARAYRIQSSAALPATATVAVSWNADDQLSFGTNPELYLAQSPAVSGSTALWTARSAANTTVGAIPATGSRTSTAGVSLANGEFFAFASSTPSTTDVAVLEAGVQTDVLCVDGTDVITSSIRNTNFLPIDFATTPMTVAYTVNGVTTTSTVNTGTLAPLASLTHTSGNLNLSGAAKNIKVKATLTGSTVVSNDSVVADFQDRNAFIDFGATKTFPMGTNVQANLKFYQGLRITEAVKFINSTGQGVLPSYATTATDLIEISNLGKMTIDLNPIVLEVFGAGARTWSFPAGATLAPGQVAVVHLGPGTDVPASRYYNTGGSGDLVSSSSAYGALLKDSATSYVIDVMADRGSPTGTIALPTGTPAASWNGNVGGTGSGVAGLWLGSANSMIQGAAWNRSSAASLLTIGVLNPGLTAQSAAGTIAWSAPFTGTSVTATSGAITTPGPLVVTATISGAPCTDIVRDTLTILAPAKPVVAFGPNTKDVLSGLYNKSTVVTFTDSTVNFPTSWAWSFTPNTVTYVQGTSATSQNPKVVFNNPGTYQVQLIAANVTGSDTLVEPITVLPGQAVRVFMRTDRFADEVIYRFKDVTTNKVWVQRGPFAQVNPWSANAATRVDTVLIPQSSNPFEFRFIDTYGDGLVDGTNPDGIFEATLICNWGNPVILAGGGASAYDPGGTTSNVASWDSIVFNVDCRQPATYHVSVNMNQQTVSTNGVRIAGNFQGWNPATTPMTDANGDGIYEYTINTFVGEKIEYKFINGNAWGSDETVPLACRYNNSWNRGDSISTVADTAATVCFALCYNCAGVTFQVDMNQVSQSFTTPEVNGLWNNWCGNCNPLTDANGDGIWTTKLPLAIGTTQEYKFSADNWAIQEQNNPAAPCTNGNATYTNRVLVIPATDTVLNVVCWSQCTGCDVDVTLKVNMAWEKANNAISANGVHVAGDFQGWNPSGTPMTDANNDGIYEVTINVPANSSIQYKFINGNAWGADESVPSACVVTGTWNRGATFAYGDSTLNPVCFGKCTDCMASIDEALQNVSLFPNPNRGQFQLARMDASTNVEVSILDLQGKVLTVAKWNEGEESLSVDLGNFANGVYMVRLTSEEGSRTLRVSVQK